MARPAQTGRRRTARWVVAEALAEAAKCFPYLKPSKPRVEGLEPREAALALAIYRTSMQRWLSIEYLLDLHLRKPMRLLEPRLRGVLLSGAAQLLFMDRLPPHAVVDESARVARSMVRPGATALINAVLRRLSEQVCHSTSSQPWALSADCLPLDRGVVVLRAGLLPDPVKLVDHLSVATSHPRLLIERWLHRYGREQTIAICRHGVATPPVIVATEPSAAGGADVGLTNPHVADGFRVWTGTRDQLVAWLGEHAARRVQDPASAEPIQATARLDPAWCVDYCAGRGTKTRQAAWLHPHAQLVATDVAADRVADLKFAFEGHPRVCVVATAGVAGACPREGVDLLVLDVPCTNTATLGRRPEARYRFSDRTLASLVGLQRRIIDAAIGLLRPGGHLLYSTCSLEEQENQHQARWMVRQHAMAVVRESQVLPAGVGVAYHDGSYHALLTTKKG